MNSKALLYTAVPLIAIGGLVGWRYSTKTGEESKLKAEQKARSTAPMLVQTAVAAPATIEDDLELVATLESPYVSKLAAKSAARVISVEAREGDPVRPGQVLVRLDDNDARGAVLSAQSQLAEARSRLAQAQIVQASTAVGVTSQVRKDNAGLASTQADANQVKASAASQLATAQAAVTDAEAKLGVAEAQETSANADLVTAQANQENANQKYTRMNDLYKQGFAAPQDVDDARTALNVQNASVKAAQSKVAAAKASVKSAQASLSSAKSQLTITSNKVTSDIAAANARVEQANATAESSVANTSQIKAYASNIAALQAAVNAAQGQLSQAQAHLGDASLAAQFEGAVNQRAADPGSIVNPGQILMTVQYLKWLYVTVQVPVGAVPGMTPGQEAEFTVEGLETKFTAKLAQVSAAADPTSRQVLARFKVENPDGILRPGAFARLHLKQNAVQAPVTVPVDAVEHVGDAAVVFKVVDGKAKAVTVKTGAENRAVVQVTGDIQPGDKVVLVSVRTPRDGQAVKEEEKKAKEGKAAKT